MLDKRVDKSEFFLTFHIDGAQVTEYIPNKYGNTETLLRTKYRKLLDNLGVKHYYWHYRHFFTTTNRKTQDLLFIQHVYETHDGAPEDKREHKFFNKMVRLYGVEYNTLILPKIELEKKEEPATHAYALAYYKRWLQKPTPNIKRLYHGIDDYEVFEILGDMMQIHRREHQKFINKRNYLKKKLLKQKTKNK